MNRSNSNSNRLLIKNILHSTRYFLKHIHGLTYLIFIANLECSTIAIPFTNTLRQKAIKWLVQSHDRVRIWTQAMCQQIWDLYFHITFQTPILSEYSGLSSRNLRFPYVLDIRIIKHIPKTGFKYSRFSREKIWDYSTVVRLNLLCLRINWILMGWCFKGTL